MARPLANFRYTSKVRRLLNLDFGKSGDGARVSKGDLANGLRFYAGLVNEALDRRHLHPAQNAQPFLPGRQTREAHCLTNPAQRKRRAVAENHDAYADEGSGTSSDGFASPDNAPCTSSDIDLDADAESEQDPDVDGRETLI